MFKTPLNDYMKTHGLSQADMAELVGLTQGAISKMLLRQRSVFVIDSGSAVSLVEEKVVAAPSAKVSQEPAV
jgi:predicted transcriptional regulator